MMESQNQHGLSKKREPKRSSRTIHQAISSVLLPAGQAMSADEIYQQIVAKGLYDFQAQSPVHVVASTLRRHCVNLDYPSARRDKLFELVDGKYRRLPQPVRVEPTAFEVASTSKRNVATIVTVPPEEFPESEVATERGPTHTEMQYRLLEVGARLGLSVWAPMNDRGRTWQGKKVGDIERLVRELPPQFDPVAMKTVSYIDVIWLEKQAIVAAFEIEHTSAVYSGLLRMADLMTLVPNQEIRWYIVAPEERFAKFAFQIGRPTFAHLRKPLHTVCKFLPYGVLVQQLENAEQFLTHMRPEFIGDLAVAYDPKDAIDEPKR